jgi:hypothetical protein
VRMRHAAQESGRGQPRRRPAAAAVRRCLILCISLECLARPTLG